MEKPNRTNKKFWMILALSVVIAALFGVALLPAIFEKREAPAASEVVTVDAEAVRVLGCCGAYLAATDFSTEMSGSIRASVVGVPYTQKVNGGRTAKTDGSFTDVAESKSALVKAAIKKEGAGGEYFVSRGEYKKKAFRYGEKTTLTKSDYIAQYGKPFIGLVKYNTETTIISAESVGENTYKFVLDPVKSTTYCRNEVKTMLGGKKYPVYKSVEFTLTTDGERPVKVMSVEKFHIDQFGGADCTAQYEETFCF